MKHYDMSEIYAFADGFQAASVLKEMRNHISTCETCKSRLEKAKAGNSLVGEIKGAFACGAETVLPAKIESQLKKKLTTALSGKPGTARPIPDLPPQHPDAPTIPEYSLIEKIDRGGYGTVWLAQDRLGSKCAVKILDRNEKHNTDEKEIGNLILASKLSHPNLIAIKHVGKSGGIWHYVMELLDDTLADKMNRLRGKPISPDEALKIIMELLAGLSYCHSKDIAHRDIKPDNIGFKEGVLKIIDLGLVTSAKRTDRTLIGTPDYMPHKPSPTPELDDLYAAGMILYCMITGNTPDNFPKLPSDIEASPLFHKLNKIACKACDRDPDKRFQSAEEFMSSISPSKKSNKNPKTCLSDERSSNNGRIYQKGQTGQKTKNRETKMNSDKIQKIENAVATLKKHGFKPSDRLVKELANLENPNYKVAFIGPYQVGKTKLINEVFLGNQLLIEGKDKDEDIGGGIWTTAVTTEVCYGKEKKLSVFKWQKKAETVTVEIDGKTETKTIEVKRESNVSSDKLNPTVEDIRAATTATTQSGRTKLSNEIQSIKLFWPAESLKRYTICDTPGVDDENQELLNNTTYRIIPESDAAVLVVGCAMLGQVELDFLRSRIFEESQGLSRIMVLISHHANKKKSAESRSELIGTIKAQINAIGRGHIPVKMICYDETVAGDILNTPDKIEKEILGFLDANVQEGRIEKASMVTRYELLNAIKVISTKLAFADKSDAQRKKILEEIRQKEDELKDKYDEITSGICSDLMDMKAEMLPEFSGKILSSIEVYLDGFKDCPDVASAQDRLQRASLILKPDIERLVLDIREMAKEKTDEIIEKYQEKLKTVNRAFDSLIGVEIEIDGGLISKIPSEIITIIDYVLTIIIVPGGPIINIIERFIAEKIPFIKNFIPGNIIKNIMISSIANSVRSQANIITSQMSEQFSQAFQNAQVEIRNEFNKTFAREVQAIRETAEVSAGKTVSVEEKNALLTGKVEIESEIRNIA